VYVRETKGDGLLVKIVFYYHSSYIAMFPSIKSSEHRPNRELLEDLGQVAQDASELFVLEERKQ
jgi:hypothetical protein